ncbi:Sodium/calcium exchanger membrane region [Metarhizium album ARSEF 1941]|uniref:Sodium/calcium exchanger membrane region n=1 Tax=Metarhizium album (strain ARSEF 1941) TaxID=1081103 RepID=A0A0B2X3I4_METAS|nr:Sodium/calcium exchanger membrane region [Metarhizium album ARSEF 1941]KHN99870.1 Sodium/calcium exchanger membrane region [Metarhizium album ARSEF 1941]
MPQDTSIPYDISVFVSTLFLLEFATDKFISHTAKLASLINVSELLIGLVTAGAEWEELAVVVSSLGQGRSSLALGNVIGASISNILGAFSLGLLCSGDLEFDRGSRIYSLLTLVLTTLIIPVVYYSSRVSCIVCGSILIGGFVIYFVSIGVAVVKGVLISPEDSDSDSDDGDGDDDGDTERTALLNNPSPGPPRHAITHHALQLVFGIAALALSAYILAHSAASITTQLHISDISFGVVVLSIATTLPEKLISVVSGYRGRGQILVANCAGSNIFLLSLCCGIVLISTRGELDKGTVTIGELAVLWLSTLAFTVTVWFGGTGAKVIGVVMVLGYVAFIVLEYAVIHRVDL